MKNHAQALMRAAILCSLSAAAVACGDMQKAADDMCDTASSLGDVVDDWMNDPPMRQRYDMCKREEGTWTQSVEVSACEDGVATLHIVFDERNERVMQQDCVGGEGLTYEHQCLHLTESGEPYFNDGPSAPHLLQAVVTALHDDVDQFQWNELFWHGAVNHDYCYHHGEARGLEQSDCDEQFHIDMYSVCARDDLNEKEWFSRDLCQTQADAMFSAVRSGGASSYAAMSTAVDYPEWKPLWKVFGMDEQPEMGSSFTESVTSLAEAF